MINVVNLKKELASIETALPLIKKMASEGRSQYDISLVLIEQGLNKRNGKPWGPWGVSRLLKANKGA